MKIKSPVYTLFIGIVAVFLFALSVFNFFQSKKSVKCANTISCKRSLELNVENDALGFFNNQEIIPPQIDLSQKEDIKNVLGETAASGEKRVYVDLSRQTLSAYEGDNLFMETLISSGKWYPTPPGEYTVWVKLRSTRMTGGTGADYYDLPNVPYVMFFYNKDIPKMKGYSLHGAYWHNNFGHPMSHGCVNMRIIDAQKLYNWIDPPTSGSITYTDADNPGTKVIIYGEAP